MLLPTTCPVCERSGPAPCGACVARMAPPPQLPTPAGLDRCLAAMAYADAGRELVARLKYRNARASLRWLAGAMAALVDERVDVVTWAPTSPARRRRRGFDQAALLARAIAPRVGAPCARLLDRAEGPAQTGASASVRSHAHPGLRARSPIAGTVLVVDDVCTTGATLSAAAGALRAAGAARVVALVAARTPAPGALH